MDFLENPSALYLIAGIGVVVAMALMFVISRFLPQGRLHLPYKRVELLSAAEKKFFRALELVFPNDRYCVFTKVRLADLFAVTGVREREHWKYFAKISQKHVDFLVVDRRTLEPFCGIELDDSSHSQKKRIERDTFVNALCEKIGLPLHRFRAAAYYDPEVIRGKVGNSFTAISRDGKD